MIEEMEPAFDQDVGLVHENLRSPGYHTKLLDGQIVHGTRSNLDYAGLLLMSDNPEWHARAATVLEVVLDMQDTDPSSETYGLWPWYAEEPLEQMSPPDWNWADFCGVRIATILGFAEDRLPAATVSRLRDALRHAGYSIFRRQVTLEYTNIAVKGSILTTVAGEMLGDEELFTYGRNRLRRFLALTHANDDSFVEFNSPPYSTLVIHELERGLMLVKDPEARAMIQTIHTLMWKMVAEHFHGPTAQWAGPNSRTYSDRLLPEYAAFLSARQPYEVKPHPTTSQRSWMVELASLMIQPLDCPKSYQGYFAETIEQPVTRRVAFKSAVDDYGPTIATTWMDQVATIGSANRMAFWDQARPLVGYWRTDEDSAVLLRMNVLMNGRSFSSAQLRSVQNGPQVLWAVNFVTDRGAFHPHLDKPEGGRFQVQDMRVVFRLNGVGVACQQLGDDHYVLSAGSRQVEIRPGSCQFMGRPVVWRLEEEPGEVRLAGILIDSPEVFQVEKLTQTALGGVLAVTETHSNTQAPQPVTLTVLDHDGFRVQGSFDAEAEVFDVDWLEISR